MHLYYPNAKVEVAKVIEAVPACNTPLNAPFLGLVINIHAETNPHRDNGDLDHCVVIPCGEFDGGQIVYYELNLVVEVPSGAMASFDSVRITHWNFEVIVEGDKCRYSIILHTDKSIKGYIRHKNNWIEFLDNINSDTH